MKAMTNRRAKKEMWMSRLGGLPDQCHGDGEADANQEQHRQQCGSPAGLGNRQGAVTLLSV